MRLRTKTGLAAIGSLAAILLLLRLIAQLTILEPFEVLEADDLVSDLRRSAGDIEREAQRLRSVAKDYGHWDDSFHFAAKPSPEFVAANFTASTFQNLSYDFVLIFDGALRPLATASDPPDGTQLRSAPQSLVEGVREQIAPASPLASPDGGHGIIPYGDGWAVVGTSTILNSQDEGPSRGTVIFGRFVDKELLGEIVLHPDVQLDIHPWDPALPLPVGFEQWDTTAPGGEVVALDQQTAYGRIAVKDLHGNPSFWLEGRKQLKSYPQAVLSIRTFTVLLTLSGLAFAFIILAGLRKLVVSRIENLQAAAHRVRANPYSTACFRDTESDEIGDLARSIENMVLGLRQVAADLKEGEERLRHVLDATNEGIWDWDLRTGEIRYSARWAAMLGLQESQLRPIASEWLDRVHPEEREALDALIKLHLAGESEVLRAEYRIRDVDGTYRWVFCRGLATRDQAGNPLRFAGSQTDITDKRMAEERLVHDALHDKLTGLPNRTLFVEWLGRCMNRMVRHPEYRFALLYLDLDHFKNINDSLGHLAGDELLRQFGQLLVSCVRTGDSVGRLSGDEFVILAEDIADIDSVQHLAARIQHATTKPFNVAGAEFFIGVSIGIALSEPHYDKPEDMLRDADTALYRAKEMGRGQAAIFDSAMRELVTLRLDLDTDLRRALEREEFRLVYQPIVSLPDGVPIGLEALVRWNHPVRGLVSPADFIPLAEDTGLIVGIGEWVFRRACSDLARWSHDLPQSTRLTMAINVSARQFRRSNLLGLLESVVRDHGVPATRLKLEITESVLMEDPLQASSVIGQIRETGASISLDDFGTGYSSLSYLQRFDIDVLKIDGSFVRGLADGTKNEGIVRALVVLAASLQVPVVAEGVETEAQREVLSGMGCQFAQGYLFSRPLAEPELLAYLRANLPNA